MHNFVAACVFAGAFVTAVWAMAEPFMDRTPFNRYTGS
jgi:hypothetical protein